MSSWLTIGGLLAVTLIGFFGADTFFLKLIQHIRKKSSDRCLKIFKILSFTPLVVAVLFLVPFTFFVLSGDFYWVIVLVASGIFSLGFSYIGKYVFRRKRPFGHITYLGEVDSAFPSAHAAGSFSAAFSMALYLNWSPIALFIIVLAVLISISRMYLQLHFFSDLAGGVLLAYLVVNLLVESDLMSFFGF